jgi:cyclase
MTQLIQHRLRIFIAAAIVAMPRAGLAQVAYDHMSSAGTDITKTMIADGIYQFTTVRDAYVRQLNSTVVVNENDVLVFDTNTRPSSARLILAEIRKITSKPVRFVVNSHGHPDHWSGNEVYATAFPGLDIIATQQMRDIMMRDAGIWVPRFTAELANRRTAFDEETRTGKRADGCALSAEQRQQDKDDLENYRTFTDETVALRRVFPTLTYGDSLTLFHGGRELRFLSVTGDQEGTTVLYLPKEKILIAGDAISYPIPYYNTTPSAQLRGLRMLEAMDIDVIIPGHGPAFHDKAFLGLERRFLEIIIDSVAAERRRGVNTVEEMQKRVTVDELHDAFVHGDSDLDARFRSRVHDVVAFAFAEQRSR